MKTHIITATLFIAPLLMAQAPAITAKDRNVLVSQAESQIENLPSVKGRFVQIDPSGNSVNGTFYLWRPGKLRFEYDAPHPSLVVADGYNVKVQDKDMGTIDTYPISTTPLKLLLARDIDLKRNTKVTNIDRNQNTTAITMKDAKGEMDGTITLVFDKAMEKLLGWRIEDAQGQKTSVYLSGLQSVKPNPALFKLRERRNRRSR